mgnify:CR=1 FL=1
MIEVVGARGTIQNVDEFLQQLLGFSEEHHLVIQALDAKAVYGKDHLVSAAEHAVRAFHQGRNAMNSLALELLLYAAGERQIQKAIKKMGVKQGKGQVAFVIIDKKKRPAKGKTNDMIVASLVRIFHFVRDDKVLEGTKDTLTRFGITQREIWTVPEQRYGDLILEKVALVDVIK